MSYILDALRRADAERERGGVPSIHTQQQFTPFGGDDDAEAPSRRLRWVVAGLAVALVAAVAWILLRPSSEAPLVPVPRTIGVLPQPAAGPPPTLAGPTGTTGTAAMPGANPPGPATVPPTTPAPGTAVALAPPTAPLATTTPPGGSPSPMTPPPRRAPRQGPPPSSDRTSAASREGGARAAAQETQGPADPSTPVKTAPDKAAPEKTGAGKPPPDKSGAPDTERVYAQRELPDDVRRALPPITVSGSTFSNDAASRMLMIGGLLYHEGDTVAPGVVLQRIKQRSAILAFRGYRYEMTF